MNKTRRGRRAMGAAKKDRKAGSRAGRLLALLSVLAAGGRGSRRAMAHPLPSRGGDHTGRGYPVAGGYDMGRLLQ